MNTTVSCEQPLQKHTKIYLDYFSLHGEPYIPCEVCLSSAVDIHHISARGMGGSKTKDYIENLMALCRNCHDKYGDKKQYRDFLNSIHLPKVQALKQVA